MKAKNYLSAYDILKKASLTPRSPLDNLFVETDIGAWKLQSCLAEVCWNLKKFKETLIFCEHVANAEGAPIATRDEMRKNAASLISNRYVDTP